MLSKNQAKFIRLLHLRKHREEHQCFVAEGTKLVLDLLESDYKVHDLFATQEWFESHAQLKHDQDILTKVTKEEMERITGLASPSPVLAVVRIPEYEPFDEIRITDLTLVLDEIKDPGNLGTIIRIADWFGIMTVICSETTVELYNPKVIQATMGSISRVKVKYLDLQEFLQTIEPESPVYGTFLEGENIYNTDLRNQAILMIGSESHGISGYLESVITKRLHIPSYNGENQGIRGAPESLNASVATAIACAEFRRRMMK